MLSVKSSVEYLDNDWTSKRKETVKWKRWRERVGKKGKRRRKTEIVNLNRRNGLPRGHRHISCRLRPRCHVSRYYFTPRSLLFFSSLRVLLRALFRDYVALKTCRSRVENLTSFYYIHRYTPLKKKKKEKGAIRELNCDKRQIRWTTALNYQYILSFSFSFLPRSSYHYVSNKFLYTLQFYEMTSLYLNITVINATALK